MVGDTYTIKLPQFEGPFDLLLFFIERDELDVNDIPIHTITEDFLTYVREMERLSIDLASEFILVAATLCKIKAKMLLPRKPIDEEGNEVDPREELVRRLIEYKRYKSVLDEMRALEEERSTFHDRGNITRELRNVANKALVDAELESLTLFRLLKTFEKVMSRLETEGNRQVHTIMRYNYTIKDQQTYLLGRVKIGEKSDFKMVFGGLENRVHAIVTFLALLELVNSQLIRLVQGEGANNFWLTKPEADTEAPPAEAL